MSDDQAAPVSEILRQDSPAPVPEPFAPLNPDLGVATFTPQAKAQLAELSTTPQLEVLENQIANQNQIIQARMRIR